MLRTHGQDEVGTALFVFKPQHHSRRCARGHPYEPDSVVSILYADNHLTAVRHSRTTKSPTKMETPASFTFITGNSPAQLKSKKNMTQVRKQAMNSYLSHDDKKPGPVVRRSVSNASDEPPSTVVTQDPNVAPPITATIRSRQSSSGSEQHGSTRLVATNARIRNTMRAPIQSAIPQNTQALVLSLRPIVELSRERDDLEFDITAIPLLRSLGENLDPFRAMYQSSNSRISSQELKFHCSRYFGTRGLGKYWIPHCVDHPHTFLSTLCLAAAHRDVIYERPNESYETAALRQDIIMMVGENLRNPTDSVADHNIIAVSQVIIADIIARKSADLGFHERGMETMITQRGGLSQLGASGHLASAVSWVHLASAVLRETKPQPMYFDFSDAKKSIIHPIDAVIPESPIYCPRGIFVTLSNFPECNQRTRDLLNDIRTMIDMFLDETKEKRRNSSTLMNLYTKIATEYPTASQLRRENMLGLADWRYEAIRITAIVQATAIVRRIPLSQALVFAMSSIQSRKASTVSIASRSNESVFSTLENQQVTPSTDYSTSPLSSFPSSSSPAVDGSCFPFDAQSLAHLSSPSAHRPYNASGWSTLPDINYFQSPRLPRPTEPASVLRDLKNALEYSNLSYCWSHMAGVLLWIGLVMGAASRDNESKILSRYFSATAMRAGIMLCFEHPEAIHSTMVRMTDVVESLASSGGSKVEVVTKKQRQKK